MSEDAVLIVAIVLQELFFIALLYSWKKRWYAIGRLDGYKAAREIFENQHKYVTKAMSEHFVQTTYEQSRMN